MTNAVYAKPDANAPLTNAYNESMSYDKNGNITNLLRNGGQDQPVNQPVAIDNLTYQYIANTNQLLTVSDSSNSTEGFKDVVSTQDYNYDNFGNQNKDDNKGITLIKYNHLNLPTEIIFTPTKKITYLYDASGDKLQKVVTEGPQVITTDYLDGFQYRNAVLQFFPHAEGYVINTQTVAPSGVKIDNYNYVYNYLDHLGNVRVSYTWDVATNALKIIEENGYYPYGLKHSGYNGSLERHRAVANETKVELRGVPSSGSGTVEASLNQYKFNGQEWQSELALNLYDMDMRDYDPAIGRWLAIDPVTHFSQSPYNAFDGNPVFWADPSGADGIGINTWHMAGSNYSTSGGSGQLANGDHMMGSSGDVFWMSNGLNSSYGAAYEMSWEGHLAAGITTLHGNAAIEALRGYASGTSDDDPELPGTILPAVTLKYNFKIGRFAPNSSGILENHYNINSPYVHVGRDMLRGLAGGLQDGGDIIAGIGYALTMTGVFAEIGIPLAALGNGMSAAGSVLSIGVDFYSQGITSGNAWKSVGFQVAGKLGGHYINKLDDFEGVGKDILKQNFDLKIMATERIIDYKKNQK